MQLKFMQRSWLDVLAELSRKFRVVEREIVVIWSSAAPYFDGACDSDQLPFVGGMLIREAQVPCCEDGIIVIWSLAAIISFMCHVWLIRWTYRVEV